MVRVWLTCEKNEWKGFRKTILAHWKYWEKHTPGNCVNAAFSPGFRNACCVWWLPHQLTLSAGNRALEWCMTWCRKLPLSSKRDGCWPGVGGHGNRKGKLPGLVDMETGRGSFKGWWTWKREGELQKKDMETGREASRVGGHWNRKGKLQGIGGHGSRKGKLQGLMDMQTGRGSFWKRTWKQKGELLKKDMETGRGSFRKRTWKQEGRALEKQS